jgi:hypothetical protein
MPAHGRVDLLEEDVRLPRRAPREGPPDDLAGRPFRLRARVEILRDDRAIRAARGIEEDRHAPRAAEEGRGAVGGAGQVVRKDQDARQ